MSAQTKDMTKGEPAKLIFMFTLPLIAGNMFQQLYAFVDTLIVGRFLGVEALAAVGCTGSLMFLMLGFVIGTTSGFAIYTGQRFGAKDEAGLRKSVVSCTYLSLITGAVLTAIGLLMVRWLLIFMQTPPEILDGAYSFISIIYAGIIVFVILNMQTNIIRALGDSKTPTYIMAVGLTINIILEPVAIVLLGWGIQGAALATVFSQFIGIVITTVYIIKKLPILRPRREDWRWDGKNIKAHLRLGMPMGFQTSIIAIGAIMIQIALNKLGPIAVASFAAAQKIDAVALMPMMSFGTAMAAYTAQNYGARKFARIEEGVKKCIYMSGGFSIFAAVIIILFGSNIIYLFVGPGQDEVIAYGWQYLLLNGIFYWILALLFIYRFTLQGLGKSTVPTIAGFMELIMRAAAAIWLVDIWGYAGACLSSPLAWLGAAVPLGISYYKTRRVLRRRAEAEVSA